jgi:hypothetical protein
MAIDLLALEIKTFKRNKPSLLERAHGKFVLIHKKKIIDIFNSESEAISFGYETLGNIPFLVKEVLAEDQVIFIGG